MSRSETVRSPIDSYLHTLLAEFADADDGEVATYMPELGRADPEWFSICVCTTDGHVYEVGDSDLDFTIQSLDAKPAARDDDVFIFWLTRPAPE